MLIVTIHAARQTTLEVADLGGGPVGGVVLLVLLLRVGRALRRLRLPPRRRRLLVARGGRRGRRPAASKSREERSSSGFPERHRRLLVTARNPCLGVHYSTNAQSESSPFCGRRFASLESSITWRVTVSRYCDSLSSHAWSAACAPCAALFERLISYTCCGVVCYSTRLDAVGLPVRTLPTLAASC